MSLPLHVQVRSHDPITLLLTILRNTNKAASHSGEFMKGNRLSSRTDSLICFPYLGPVIARGKKSISHYDGRIGETLGVNKLISWNAERLGKSEKNRL